MSASFGTFFLPGPTEVRPEILAAMARPMIAHRGAAFESLFARLQEGLRPLFGTARPVFVSTSSATGLMEASLRSAPPGPILSLVNGDFAERYARIAAACGRESDTIRAPLGESVPLERVERALAERRYAAATLVHCESTTGVLADVAGFARLCAAHGVLSLVDSVTGVGGVPVATDAWGVDFVLTASQKALALPPGLAFAVASERYLARVAEAPARGVYLDVGRFASAAGRNQTPNTPALPLLYALDAQLEAIASEGLAQRFTRHEAMAERVARWVEALGAVRGERPSIVAVAPSRSPTMTAIRLPGGIAGPDFAAAVERRGFVVGAGYGSLKESTFRIGHMGDHTPAGLEGLLRACEDALAELGEESLRR